MNVKRFTVIVLGVAPAVRLCRIDEGDTLFQRRVENLTAGDFIEFASKERPPQSERPGTTVMHVFD